MNVNYNPVSAVMIFEGFGSFGKVDIFKTSV